MGLSEQSFTIEEKAKLSGLTNYNDSGIRKTITDLEGEVAKKANKTDIPDISGKADRTELPTRVYFMFRDARRILRGSPNEEHLLESGYLYCIIHRSRGTLDSQRYWRKVLKQNFNTLQVLLLLS